VRLTNYYIPILRENPSEASIVSHRLMLRSGMIRQVTSGIYSFLPLGVKVLHKIKNIIDKRMQEAGCLEVIMPTVQPASLWHKTGRYDAYGKETLRMQDRHDNELLFAPTAEDVITEMVSNTVNSYRSFPKILYQTTWKFRDEIRPRFGLMRGREFLMKDAYSFDLNEENAVRSYKLIYATYLKIFEDMGLVAVPVKADNGVIGGDLSHEFHVIAETGESALYIDKRMIESMQLHKDFDHLNGFYAATDEKLDPAIHASLGEHLSLSRGIEVGHIFNFGLKYSKALDFQITLPDGNKVYPNMGSYGIGVSRLAAAIIEASHDERGIVWPSSVSPFDAMLINLKTSDANATNISEMLYQSLADKIDILYDDTDDTVGSKLATADLIGITKQIIVGPKNASEGKVELKDRKTGQSQIINAAQLKDYI
jgi:prolyl-tRNA synthetase